MQTTTQPATREPGALYDQFTGLRRERKLRHRDAAHELGVAEGRPEQMRWAIMTPRR